MTLISMIQFYFYHVFILIGLIREHFTYKAFFEIFEFLKISHTLFLFS